MPLSLTRKRSFDKAQNIFGKIKSGILSFLFGGTAHKKYIFEGWAFRSHKIPPCSCWHSSPETSIRTHHRNQWNVYLLYVFVINTYRLWYSRNMWVVFNHALCWYSHTNTCFVDSLCAPTKRKESNNLPSLPTTAKVDGCILQWFLGWKVNWTVKKCRNLVKYYSKAIRIYSNNHFKTSNLNMCVHVSHSSTDLGVQNLFIANSYRQTVIILLFAPQQT